MTWLSAGFRYYAHLIRSLALYPDELRARMGKAAVSDRFPALARQWRSGTERKQAAHGGTLLSQCQTQNSPMERWRAHTGPDHETCCGGYMADAFPKMILSLLEGDIGKLREMRFWSKVDMRGPDECWLWQGAVNSNGYGSFKIASYEVATASRVALIVAKREEPSGMLVLHRCDTPRCCNPAHLYFGTTKQNSDDKVRRGRHRNGVLRGERNPCAKLSGDDLRLIVSRLKDGWNNTQIAQDLPVSHAQVSLIRLGKSWRDEAAQAGWQPVNRERLSQ